MRPLTLRGYIKYIVAFIADDIDTAQTDTEPLDKSHGEKPRAPIDSMAEIHAALRQAGGFNMDQMVSEYRALRASVTKLWTAQRGQASECDIRDLVRFKESVDQALTESIAFYTKKLDHSRNLFLGILGHDLRNLLGAVVMAAELMARIGRLNERQAMLGTQIVISAGRASEILGHLLDLTRARLGSGLHILREQMDLAFVRRQLVDEMRIAHPDRRFTIGISGDTKGAGTGRASARFCRICSETQYSMASPTCRSTSRSKAVRTMS